MHLSENARIISSYAWRELLFRKVKTLARLLFGPPSLQVISFVFVLSFLAIISLRAQTGSAQQGASSVSSTDVPRTMSYQGYLTGSDGKPIRDGQYAVSVKLYNDPEGMHAVYEATYQAAVVNGLFNILLGSGNSPLPSVAVMNAPLWIGITVNGHEELKPYTPLSASPYALNVPNDAISSDKISDGAVTSRKIGTDYVGSLWLDGDKITNHGSKINLEGANGIAINFDITRNTIVFSGNGAIGAGPLATNFPPESSGSGRTGNTGDLVANGDVDLGGTAPDPLIRFTGKASTSLDMNQNDLTNVSDLFLGKGKAVSGQLVLYSSGSLNHATIVASPHFSNHTYAIPDAGSNAQFVMSAGNQVIEGTKTFNQPINGNIAGNATTATTAVRSSITETVANTFKSGGSIVSALMTNGGTISNNTTGNAKTATLATSALEAAHAEVADRIAFSYSAGSSISSALNSWGGILSNSTSGNAATVTNGVYTTGSYRDPFWITSITGSKITGVVQNSAHADQAVHATTADRAQNASQADLATKSLNANQADELINSLAAGQSVSKALATWGGTLNNNISGNAASVTNGLYSNRTYADPAWLTSLSASKLVGPVSRAEFATSAGSAVPSGIAKGDLAGSYPEPKVVAVEPEAGGSIVNAINGSSATISGVSLAKNLTISGGSINNSPIGSSTPSTGAFTTVQSTTTLGASVNPKPGTQYADNIVIAWGEINSDGTIKAQFGNVAVVHNGLGNYTITLPESPEAAAVTVTSESGAPMTFSAIRTGSSIAIQGYDLTEAARPADAAFYFIVVARR